MTSASALLARHRRFGEVIARASRGNLGVDQPLAFAELVRHAGIDDHHLHAVQAREDIGAGAALQVVLDHLPAHVLRVGGNARRCRPVVAGKDQHVRVVEGRRKGVLDPPEFQRDLFELAERAERLGLVVDLVLEVGVEGVSDRADGERHGDAR